MNSLIKYVGKRLPIFVKEPLIQLYQKYELLVYDEIPYRLLNGYALPPRQALILLTFRCILSCKMCFLREKVKKQKIQRN